MSLSCHHLTKAVSTEFFVCVLPATRHTQQGGLMNLAIHGAAVLPQWEMEFFPTQQRKLSGGTWGFSLPIFLVMRLSQLS